MYRGARSLTTPGPGLGERDVEARASAAVRPRETGPDLSVNPQRFASKAPTTSPVPDMAGDDATQAPIS